MRYSHFPDEVEPHTTFKKWFDRIAGWAFILAITAIVAQSYGIPELVLTWLGYNV